MKLNIPVRAAIAGAVWWMTVVSPVLYLREQGDWYDRAYLYQRHCIEAASSVPIGQAQKEMAACYAATDKTLAQFDRSYFWWGSVGLAAASGTLLLILYALIYATVRWILRGRALME